MKLADLDWRGILATLPDWEALSPAARRAFVEVEPAGTAGSVLGAAKAELEKAGMIAGAGARGTLWEATPRYHALLLALRSMHALPVLAIHDEALAEAYVREHVTKAEATLMTRHRFGGGFDWVNHRDAAERAWSFDWVDGFLAQQDLRAAVRWEANLLTPGEPSRLARNGIFDPLRALVRSFAGNPRGISLGGILPGLDDDTRAAVLSAGFRYLLLFPALLGEEPEARVGLAPGAALRMGPAPPAPEAVRPEESFEAPYMLADMTAVLVEAATSPIPLRGSDGALYARAQKVLASRLQPLPEWVATAVGKGPGDDYDDEEDDEPEEDRGRRNPDSELSHRTAAAAQMLLRSALATTRKDRGGKFHLAATKAGEQWLRLGEGERLSVLLKAFRASDQRNPHGWYGTEKGTDFFPARLGFDLTKGSGLDLRAATSAAFLSVPDGQVVPLEYFLHFHGITANPFLVPGMRKILDKTYSSSKPTTREEWELLWVNMLRVFLAMRLFPFGGARLARTADGVACVGLTPAGRYLLGATDAFEYAPLPEGEVLVQPDFEIVFLAPAPRLEPEVARFADRIGAGVGALFRITRASAIRAAEQGLTADHVVGSLEQVARSGVPANVARQVRDWIGSTRRVSLRPAVLIECPDADTAARVRSAGGKQVEAITPTVLRVKAQGKDRAALVKRLREKGIFVSD
ncbi:MAG TPA: helicase-associated domain-containing protein [Longimicrobium sp.]|jgi:hypothetical protein